MIVLKSVKHITQFGAAIVTIGNFDGVHIGHQALLSKTVKIAKEVAGTSIAVTFEPHPAQIVRQDLPPKLITSLQQKQELISRQGINVFFCIPFTEKFASISAAEFIEEVMIEKVGMKVIVIGKDYTFGRNREGNISLLEEYAVKLNFRVIVEKLVGSTSILDNRVSSTAIRNMIMEGNLESANEMLDRHYCMRGKVVRGKDRGKRLLGFPTANVFPYNSLYPKRGVYIVTVKYKNQTLNGVANVGYNPTFRNKSLSLEVHILSFTNKIYGEEIEVRFIKQLRNEVKFNSISELEEQISKDITKARRYHLTKTNSDSGKTTIPVSNNQAN